MPLTGAERTRRYREKLKKQDPEKFENQKKNNLNRIKSNRKKITELTEDEAEIRRANWKKYKRTSRLKKDNSKILTDIQNENVAPSNSTSQGMVKSNSKNDSVVQKLRKKCNFLLNKCRRFTKYNEKLKTQKNTYRKRLQRLKIQRQKDIDDLNMQIVKFKVRQEVLESTLKRTYQNCNSRTEKKIFKKVVNNSENKKLITKMLGLKGKIREKEKKIRRHDIAEITKFYIRDDISRNTAGKRETRTKNKEKVQIRYLLDTLVNSFTKYKSEGGQYGFTTFYKHKPFFVLSPGLSSRNTCLCIKHSNFGFLHTALTKHGLVTGGTREIMSKVSCDTNNYDCMWNKCQECKSKKVMYEVTNDEKLGQQVEWSRWERQDHTYQKKDGETTKEISTKKTAKVTKTGTLNDLIKQYERDMILYKKHHFNMIHQQTQYQKAVTELKLNEALIVCDFSENYDAKLATEVQSMHYGASNRQISLHTGMVFWKDRSQSFCTVSDNTSHQPAAIWAHLSPIIDMIKQETPDVKIIHFYSDGPSSQYRQKNNFYLLVYFTKKYDFRYATWSFYESGHGKNVADGIGGSVKRTLDRKVCHGNDVVDAQDAYDLLKLSLKSSKVFHIHSSDIEKISNILPTKLPVLKGTMQLHQITTSQNGKSFIIKYRDVSCFCGDLRGCCDCFSPQLHSVTTPNSIDIKQKYDVMGPSTSGGSIEKRLVGDKNKYVTGDEKSETVCEPYLPLDLADISLKPFADNKFESIDANYISMFLLEESESLLGSNRDNAYPRQPNTSDGIPVIYVANNQESLPAEVGVADEDSRQLIAADKTLVVDLAYNVKCISENEGAADKVLIQPIHQIDETPPAKTLLIGNKQLPAITFPNKIKQEPEKHISGKYSTKTCKPEKCISGNEGAIDKVLIKSIHIDETPPAKKLPKGNKQLPDITLPNKIKQEPEKHSSGKYSTKTCKPKTISKIKFLECTKCLTSILGRKGKCMVCKKWYCNECIAGDFGFDYICDSCLED